MQDHSDYQDWLQCRFPAGKPTTPDWSDVATAFRAGAIIRDCAAQGDALDARWQPIETAPKDGTRVLGIVSTAPKPEAEIVFYENGDWLVGDSGTWHRTAALGFKEWYDSLTHWMPLPPPPSTTASSLPASAS